MYADALATALVIFRETLEIALILTVMLAATRGLPGRTRWVWSGLGLGVLGAGCIAAFTDTIAAQFDDRGQEIMNACILFAAAGMIGWTVIWMKRHGREMAMHMKQVGKDVMAGRAHAKVLMSIIALAVFREGAEIVLFSYGIIASGTPIGHFALGAALGASAGITVGALLYYGLLKFSTRHIFGVSSWLLALVAAGLAAKGVAFLTSAGLVPELQAEVWNSSALVPQKSLVGQLLSVLIGYEDRPNAMQLLAYAAVLAIIVGSLWFSNRPVATPHEGATRA